MTTPEIPLVDPAREKALHDAVQFCHKSSDPHTVVACATAFYDFLTTGAGAEGKHAAVGA